MNSASETEGSQGPTGTQCSENLVPFGFSLICSGYPSGTLDANSDGISDVFEDMVEQDLSGPFG